MQFVFTLPFEVAYPLQVPLTTNDEVSPCRITRMKRKAPSAIEASPIFLRVSERENNSAGNWGEFSGINSSRNHARGEIESSVKSPEILLKLLFQKKGSLSYSDQLYSQGTVPQRL